MRVIAEFVHTLPRKPGVYRMIGADGDVLYVGKARSLRSRVAAYTQPTRLETRLMRMVSNTRTMEFVVTDSEAEALLLENNLIKRCAEPCVARIEKAEYDTSVNEVRDFLGGKSREVQQTLLQRMERAAADLHFEQAAVLRDRVRALAHIQSHQSITLESIDEADIFAAHAEGGQVCVQVFFLRAGQNLGNRAYFPSHARELSEAEVLQAFIGQFYEARPAPKLILTSREVPEAELLESALAIT